MQNKPRRSGLLGHLAAIAALAGMADDAPIRRMGPAPGEEPPPMQPPDALDEAIARGLGRSYRARKRITVTSGFDPSRAHAFKYEQAEQAAKFRALKERRREARALSREGGAFLGGLHANAKARLARALEVCAIFDGLRRPLTRRERLALGRSRRRVVKVRALLGYPRTIGVGHVSNPEALERAVRGRP